MGIKQILTHKIRRIMNPRLYEIFCLYRHLRIMKTIVDEIETLDHYVEYYEEDTAIGLIDFCLTKYTKIWTNMDIF